MKLDSAGRLQITKKNYLLSPYIQTYQNSLDEEDEDVIRKNTIWVIYQNPNSLIIVREWALFDPTFKMSYDLNYSSAKKLFSAKIDKKNRFYFKYSCGITPQEIENAILYVKDDLITIELRN